MSKTISTGLETALQAGVLSLAVCVSIVRPDGRRFYLTNHDQDLTLNGDTYRHDIPITISAIATGSNLAADTCTVDIGLDGITFREQDFRPGLWKKSVVEIAEVNWANTAQGALILRRGIIRQIVLRKNGSVRLDVDGLLKILDFNVGRKYTPGCDAELGDSRCRVAIDYSQHRSFLNPYHIGDWVYWYDEAEMTPVAITNHDFADDGDRSVGQAITGWTKSTSSSWIVDDSGADVVAPRASNRVLAGTTDADNGPEDQFVYQDLDLSALSTAIDAGEILFALMAEVAHKTSLSDYAKLRVDILDINGIVIQSNSTDWFTLDTADAWREKAVIFHVVPDAVTARVYLEARRVSGTVSNINFSNIRAFTWNHTTDDPTHGLIFKALTNAPSFTTVGAFPWQYVVNAGFEFDGALPASGTGTQDITGWVKTVGAFRTAASVGAVNAKGDFALFTDPAETTCEIEQEFDLSFYNVNTTKLDNGEATFTLQNVLLFPALNGRIRLTIEFYDDSPALISSVTFPWQDGNTLGASSTRTRGAPVPPLSRSIKLIYEFDDGGSAGDNQSGLDNVQFYFTYDSERPANVALVDVGAFGSEDTAPTYTVGVTTVDEGINWKAHTQHVQLDEVAAVTDRKSFTATNMTGGDGTFDVTRIRWLSGNNAGTENIIRVWTSGTKAVKLYYPQTADIQVGDRFQYVQGCSQRFTEDCKVRFDNVINFQGFPYVPGNINE